MADRLASFEDTRHRLAGPDLARCIAIVCVLITHDGGLVAALLGARLPLHLAFLGFFGVMLFFVLSGLLIGTIILDLVEHGAGAPDWWIFLRRRWARTLPAYGASVAIIAALTPLGGQGVDMDGLGKVWAFYATLTQNLFWRPVSPWFGQSWSLCVEEWFYLGVPALLLAASALGMRRLAGFALALALLFAVPIAWRLALAPDAAWDEATSKIVTCRLDSLACGVAAAFALRRWPVLHRLWAPCLVAGSAIVIGIWWSDCLPFPLWSEDFKRIFLFDIVGLGFALCMPAAFRLRRLPAPLAWPVRTLSTHSYGLYLCHLPLALLCGELHARGLAPGPCLAFLALTTIGGAAISWRWIERPFLRLRPAQSRPTQPRAG